MTLLYTYRSRGLFALTLAAFEGDLGRFEAEGFDIEAEVGVELKLIAPEAGLFLLNKVIVGGGDELNRTRRPLTSLRQSSF